MGDNAILERELEVKKIATVEKVAKTGPDKMAQVILEDDMHAIHLKLTITGPPTDIKELLDRVGANRVGYPVGIRIVRVFEPLVKTKEGGEK